MVTNEPSKGRSRCRIFADILRAVQDNQQARVTYILHEANLPYDRLMNHLGQMESLGLIERSVKDDATYYAPTKKGRKYLAKFKEIEEFSAIFGVDV